MRTPPAALAHEEPDLPLRGWFERVGGGTERRAGAADANCQSRNADASPGGAAGRLRWSALCWRIGDQPVPRASPVPVAS